MVLGRLHGTSEFVCKRNISCICKNVFETGYVKTLLFTFYTCPLLVLHCIRADSPYTQKTYGERPVLL